MTPHTNGTTHEPARTGAQGGLPGRQSHAVRNAFALLEEVARLGPGVTAKQVGAGLSLSPATTYRLLNLLVALQYLERQPGARGFTLGHKVAQLAGFVALVHVPVAARRLLEDLRSRVRMGVHLASYAGGAPALVDPDPTQPLPPSEAISRHLHASAFGKLLLAESGDWRRAVGEGPLDRLTPRTLVSPPDLDAELAAVARADMAHQLGELRSMRACVALPVRSAAGQLVAAVALTGVPEQIRSLDQRHLASTARTARELAPLLT
ncbi:IclR family transcriptional regulator [Motilibacter deserti]|uniref:Helix-turn-helix domain-containing protein n=1 Tax=Motilibacter deserti TaxID=2714956 RepID=A0ABX0GRQ1_9ACTN|nr:IclR family transcriptional regulator C-terminal domain-containing protein [Motilibacter deserti]NHC12450.1 helix-turn-helix domain-containing protein [Motilibacter deserti]